MAAVVPAGKAIEEVAKGLTGDFVVIGTRVFRQIETKERVPTGGLTPTGRPAMTTITKVHLEPIDIEAHVNPLSILASAGLAGLGILAATVAWHGVDLPAPLGGAVELVPGIKDTGLGRDLAKRFESWQSRHPPRPPGPDLSEAVGATSTSQIDCDAARVLYSGLSDFSRGFCKFNGLTSSECLEAWQELKARCSL